MATTALPTHWLRANASDSKASLRHLRCAVALLVLLGTSSSAGESSPRDLFQRSRSAVVLITSFDATGQPLRIGSGFFVGNGSLVVTNLHVTSGASSVKVRLTSGEVETVQRSGGADPQHDLVLLRLPTKHPSLALAKREPEVGEPVVAIGNPKGLEGTLSTGVVSGIRRDGDTSYVQITAPISPGSSGGPLIASDGTVLGVATASLSGGQNLNFAVPAAYIQALVDSASDVPLAAVSRTIPTTDPAPANSLVSVAGLGLGTYLGGRGTTIVGSIVNSTSYVISDVKILVVFTDAETAVPRHYELFVWHEEVAPGLARAFSEPASRYLRSDWLARAEVLDYRMAESPGWDP